MFEFRVTQLVSAQPAEGAVQPEQLQGVAVQPMANQETREARRQEEQGADVSHVIHSHPLYTQGGSSKDASNSKDFRHLRVSSTLHLNIHRKSAYCNTGYRFDHLY